MSELISFILSIIASVTSFVTPIFVFIVCLNSGLSEDPRNVLGVFKENRKYYVRLVLVSNVLFPLFVWGVMSLLPFPAAFTQGMLVFFICAGAPIVISFTQSAGNTGIYATAAMIVSLVATIIVLPILLPIMIGNVGLNMISLIWNLVQTVIVPLVIGFSITIFSPNIKKTILPPIGITQKITMDIVIYGTLITNIPNIIALVGEFAIVTGIILVYLAFAVGYFTEKSNSNTAMQETAGFSVGQRNFAIASLVATGNLNPEVMLSIVIVYSIGLLQMRHLTSVFAKQKAANYETAEAEHVKIK